MFGPRRLPSMSKRHNKSEDAGLPDWADEVTPADEVMRKFYAPTGAFRRGPITVPVPPEAPAPPNAPPEPEAQAPELEELTASDDITPTPLLEVPSTTLESSADVSSSLVEPTPQSSPEEAGVDFPKPEPGRRTGARTARQRHVIKRPEASDVSVSTFEEFARRWKRYLYPGQLSVMRVLFQKTVEAGLSECLTRYSELAEETKMTRRNCINVMNSLVDHGFVERLEVLNDATGKGIRLKVYVEPRG